MENKEWFAEWFDSPFYHRLYSNRDDNEAKRFVEHLVAFLGLTPGQSVLDLACGKGRHSITLNACGLNVIGADLAPKSIAAAAEFSNESLSFVVHDMREVISEKHFDVVMNLFTSFGYFDSTEDNKRVLNSIHDMLHPNGLLVIDFMNAIRVVNTLVKEETKEVEGTTFQISRRYDGTHIFKDIQFSDSGKDFHFTERVQAITDQDFSALLEACGFELIRTFGDFELNPYAAETSDRLILIARKR
jgi:2-polyprenyl-3-methyl-5-hydroxy-6-metoxy-1,4-benzoquinol methylase